MSGDSDPRSAACEAIEAELPELALGTLSGRRRVAVLEHVASCARCEGEVEQLSLVADSLLRLAPEVEPPVGFEVRIFDRLGVTPPAADDEVDEPVPLEAVRRRRRPVAIALGAVAASVVALAVGFGAGWWASPRPGAPALTSSAVHVAQLESSTEMSGQVITYASSPPWLLMTVDGPGATGNVTCEVRMADGTEHAVGTFWIEKGYGSWAAPLPVSSSQVRSASLVDAHGVTLATARF